MENEALLCIIGIILILSIASFIDKKNKEKKELKDKDITLSLTLPHLMGLSVPENSFCQIYSYRDKYDFVVNGATFSLSKDKITDISLKNNTEIQKQCVSSIGGAIGGAVLLGPLGAMIGGRTKTKELKTTTNCLIFTYKKENALDFIAFDATNTYFQANKLVKEFQKGINSQNITIEL